MFIWLLVFGTTYAKTLQPIPAGDLIPPPEDQESILIRFSHPESLPPPSFFQKIVSWFGFGDPMTQSTNIKPKQPSSKLTGTGGYSYENPNKLQSYPQKQQTALNGGYNYNDPNKLPVNVHNLPHSGYNYDPPIKQIAAITPLIPAQIIHTFQPLPVLQSQILQSQVFHSQIIPAEIPQPLNQQTTLAKPSQQPQKQNGYIYNNPTKQQKQMRPPIFNDLVSSAASPTALYSYPVPARPFSLPQAEANPCNKVPWLPMFPNVETLQLLRSRAELKPNQVIKGSYVQSIARPEKNLVLSNSSIYMPARFHRQFLMSPINTLTQLTDLPGRSTPQPFRTSSSMGSTTSVHTIPSLSVTQEPPIHEAKPFTIQSLTYTNIQQNGRVTESPFNNDLIVNGQIVTQNSGPSNGIQSVQVVQQLHPTFQKQSTNQSFTEYGAPPVSQTAQVLSTSYGFPVAATTKTPSNTHGVPLKYTVSTPPFSSSTFKASQTFTLPSTPTQNDQSREGSNKIENQSNLIKDSDAEQPYRNPSTPVLQVKKNIMEITNDEFN